MSATAVKLRRRVLAHTNDCDSERLLGFGSPDGALAAAVCGCGSWWLMAPSGIERSGSDALEELTAALEGAAPDMPTHTAEEARRLAAMMRASGQGWK